MYIYYSKKIPVLLPYTFYFLRRSFQGEVLFLTNKEFPQTDLFKQYNITRRDVLDDYTNVMFYNEYKVRGIRDYGEDDAVYMDLDIFFENPLFLDIITTRQNLFANKFYASTLWLGWHFFDTPPLYGLNGGIIKLDSNIRPRYTQASVEMFERVKPFAGKLQYIDSVAEELVAATFPEISPVGYERGKNGWVHLMDPSPNVVKKLQAYKEYLDEKDK
jgi:hypothetical protein